MNNYRTERIGKEIRKIISNELQRSTFELGDGIISVSSVVVSKDFSIAKIYVSSYNSKFTPLEIINLLNTNKNHFKELIAKNMKLRIIPDLKFFLDDTLDEIEHIQSLIKKVEEEENEHTHKSK
ncbi:MAG TPA: 30S ribosome-binding factor RbfA [Candidatus Kapabacteria bacterium]|jgi:ribosome-binding factor A|nr:30S ribosome-binding factor RbfA [Candidatus Kapabacteria bacterium]HOV91862.1 30S ribosome-binding factor RbfA [Candidatus Kapabacteria bacterium]